MNTIIKEKNMYRLVVLTFDNTEEAGEVREALSKAEKGGYVSLEDYR